MNKLKNKLFLKLWGFISLLIITVILSFFIMQIYMLRHTYEKTSSHYLLEYSTKIEKNFSSNSNIDREKSLYEFENERNGIYALLNANNTIISTTSTRFIRTKLIHTIEQMAKDLKSHESHEKQFIATLSHELNTPISAVPLCGRIVVIR